MTKQITIVGVGALGSHVAMLLRNEGALRVIDFDHIEQKNVLAQFHAKPSVGKLKAQALAQTFHFLWNIKVDAKAFKLTKDNVDVLLKGSDLVLDCVDNGDARRLIQGYVRQHSIPCYHGALAADAAFGRAIWDSEFVIDDEGGPGAPTCEGGEHLPFIAVAASYVARGAQEFLRFGKRYSYSISPAGCIRV